MMAAGLEKQLLRCNGTANIPAFCNNTIVYHNVISAYNNLWNSIEVNTDQLRTEVWSWVYNNGFQVTPLGDLPAPGGGAQTESDIVQVCLLEIVNADDAVVEFDGELCGVAKPGVDGVVD
jgi:hypothetical protein